MKKLLVRMTAELEKTKTEMQYYKALSTKLVIQNEELRNVIKQRDIVMVLEK
jgi:hypothetical protein